MELVMKRRPRRWAACSKPGTERSARPASSYDAPAATTCPLEQMMAVESVIQRHIHQLWSVWDPPDGHHGPYDVALHLKDWHMQRWKQRHPHP